MKQLIGELMQGPRIHIYRCPSLDEICTVLKYPDETRGHFTFMGTNDRGTLEYLEMKVLDKKFGTHFSWEKYGAQFLIKKVFLLAEVEDPRFLEPYPYLTGIMQAELLVQCLNKMKLLMRVGVIVSTYTRVGHLFMCEEGTKRWDGDVSRAKLKKEMNEIN